MNDRSFYDYQINRFGLLVGWGIASAVTGLGLAALPLKPFWRSFGLMQAGWGIVNAGLGLLGQRGARTNAQKHPDDPAYAQTQARNMRRLLLINVPLDVLYVLSGRWLTGQKRTDRRGWGWAIVVQGGWLFLYDSLLSWEVSRKVKD